MKKIILIILMSFWMVGCGKMNNTPTKQVEMYLEKYQLLDNEVVTDLNNVAIDEERFNSNQRERYIKLMKKHYQNLTYDVKDEEIDGDNAIVKVEIEVIDLSKAKSSSEKHRDEYKNEDGTYDETKYMDYMLDNLEKSEEKVKYTINFTLTKKDKDWTLDNLTTSDEDKIQGIYEY